MKKTASILFLLMLIFNVIGYKWVLGYLEQKSVARLENKLDAGSYDTSQLVEIRIALNLPYNTEQSDYEAHYGAVILNGKNYHYVKRKIQHDTLFLLCIPHGEKNEIQLAESNYFKTVNGLEHKDTPQKSQPAVIKLLLSEFLFNECELPDTWKRNASVVMNSFNIACSSQFNPSTPVQPPDCIV